MKQFLTRKRLSLLLTTAALMLWSLGLSQSELTINYYGLISSYSIIFFISLGILTVAAALLWTSQENCHWLLALQTVMLAVSIHLTPLLLEGTTRFPAAYQNYGFVDYVLRHGHLDPQRVWYHGWPGFIILFTAFFQVTGIDSPLVVMGVFPVVVEVIYLLPLFLIYKTVTGRADNRYWAFVWIFLLINWTNQDYFSPQALAYLFLLISLAMVLRNFISEEAGSPRYIILVLMLAAITLTHLVTAVAALLMIAVLSVVWKRRDFTIATLFAVLLSAWTIYGSIFQLRTFLPRFIEEAFSADITFIYTYLFRFAETSPEHAVINSFRVAFTAACLMLALVAFTLMKGERRFSRRNISLIALAVSPVLLMPLFVYSGEFIIRVYLMLLVPVAYFAGKLLTRRTGAAVLTTLLIIAAPLHMVTHYGNEIIERVPEPEVQFSRFFFDHTSGGRVIGQLPPVLFRNIEKYSNFLTFSYTPDPEFGRLRLMAARVLPPEQKVLYLETCQRLYDVFAYAWNEPSLVPEIKAWADAWDSYNLVYNNGDVSLYAWQQAGR